MKENSRKNFIKPRSDLSDEQVNRICDKVRECAFGLHNYLGPGFREKVYERGLVHRLAKLNIAVAVQSRVSIYDEDGTELIEEVIDLIVEDVLILELKAVRVTSDGDVAQILGYLRATRFRHGCLLNFGASKFFIKKYVM